MAKRRLAVEFEGVLYGLTDDAWPALDRDMPHHRFLGLMRAVGGYDVIVYSAARRAPQREAVRAWIFATALRGFALERHPDPVKAAADLVLEIEIVQSMPGDADVVMEPDDRLGLPRGEYPPLVIRRRREPDDELRHDFDCLAAA